VPETTASARGSRARRTARASALSGWRSPIDTIASHVSNTNSPQPRTVDGRFDAPVTVTSTPLSVTLDAFSTASNFSSHVFLWRRNGGFGRDNPLTVRRLATGSKRPRKGAKGWHDPSFFPGWLRGIRSLVRMRESIERGEPPMALNPGMRVPIDPPDRIRGPGWLEPLAALQSDHTTVLPRFERPITRVDLSGTRINNDRLGSILMLRHAEYLDMTGTNISASGLRLIRGHETLREVLVPEGVLSREELKLVRAASRFAIIEVPSAS
jgi:hypothetical protein